MNTDNTLLIFIIIIAIFTMLQSTEAAEGTFYLDAGISINHKNDDIYVAQKDYAVKWKAPFFLIEFGYTKNNWTAAISHKSSIEQRDIGSNEIWLKNRLLEW